MTAGREIERKFLVEELPAGLDRWPATAVEQGYLAIEGDATEVRLRRSADRRVLTVKQGSGRDRREEEVDVSPDAFERLWPLTAGRRIAKTRYAVDAGSGLTIELDVYAGDLDGLATAEVEFAAGEDAEAFDAPPWLGAEVTDDPRYKNQALAVSGRPPAREATQ